jgi:hypothetical protein
MLSLSRAQIISLYNLSHCSPWGSEILLDTNENYINNVLVTVEYNISGMDATLWRLPEGGGRELLRGQEPRIRLDPPATNPSEAETLPGLSKAV